MRVAITAPAKINVHLDVLGRREDGFHGLETVFQTLDLADRLVVERTAEGIQLTCDAAGLGTGPENLVHRAAAAVLARRPGLGGLAIHLEKRLPMGAGIGGGSSDAASLLLAGQALLGRAGLGEIPAAELAADALALGSDVPFFLLGGTAHALGRGEVLTPLPALPGLELTLLMPEGAHCATPAVFRAMAAAERGPRPALGAPWFAARAWPAWAAAIEDGQRNRLTAAAVRVCPAVGDLLGWLRDRGVVHWMTGSGAACVAVGPVEPPAGVRAWRTRTGPGARLADA